MPEQNDLILNEWVTPNNGNFSYRVYWPYETQLNPAAETVDILVKLNGDSKFYQLTFLTLDELKRWFERFKKNGDFCSGTYVPLKNEILLKTISRNSIVKSLEDLISTGKFKQYATLSISEDTIPSR